MKFYVSTYTEGFFNEGPNGSKGIYLCEYNKKSKDIVVLNSFDKSVNPSFIKLSNDSKNLFVACEKLPPSMISNYCVDDYGNLTLNDSYILDVRSCCYISVNKENLFCTAANYGSGEVFSFAFDRNCKFIKQTSSFRNKKVGPNKERQELPHAHSIRLIDSLNTYVACDLGCDKVDFYSYRAGGFLSESAIKSLSIKPGYGPRHSDNTSDGEFLYITCELSNRVLTYQLVDGQYILRQDISSIPDNFKQDNTCADIHLSKDEKYVFVSNRGHNSIVQFMRDKDGSLSLIGFFDCNGKGPRNFAVCDELVICANQDSNDVSILEVKNGLLTGNVLAKHEFISPVCIEKL